MKHATPWNSRGKHMPCTDVTEELELILDEYERIKSYSVNKITCGISVGEQTLLPFIRGCSLDVLLTKFVVDFVPDIFTWRDTDQFLLAKQLYAVQSAVRVHLGLASGHKSNAFTVRDIEYSTDETIITGDLHVDVAAAEIPACTGCKKPKGIELQKCVSA
jgi:hypothetical protein